MIMYDTKTPIHQNRKVMSTSTNYILTQHTQGGGNAEQRVRWKGIVNHGYRTKGDNTREILLTIAKADAS